MTNSEEYLKSFGFVSIGEAFDEAKKRIEQRKDGLITPFKMKWPRFTKLLGGGLQPGTVYTIGGRPGVGKSAFVNELLFSLCERNDTNEFMICYWTWEMPAYQQMIRGFSGMLGQTVQNLMSAESPLNESLFSEIVLSRDKWTGYPIYFMSYAKTPMYIYQLTKGLSQRKPNTQIINVFDHTRLAIRDDKVFSEEEKITQLLKAAHRLSVEDDAINIFLSQLNRNIESDNRKKHPVPILSDFFGADSVAQFSNVAVILNQPSHYNMETYLNEEVKNLLAVHVLKNRDGDVAWIPFEHDLANNQIEERYPPVNQITYAL